MNKQPIPEDHLLEVSDQMKANRQLPTPKSSKLMLKDNRPFGLLPKRSLTYLKISRGKLRIIIASIVVVIIALIVASVSWYFISLEPVDSSSKDYQAVVIKRGLTYQQIEDLLEQNKLIKSRFALDIYLWISGHRNDLKAGAYSLSKSQSTQDIVDKIVSGKSSTISVMFLPGDTVEAHKKRLIKLGFSKEEVDSAFAASYSGDLFADKPSSADLEGYVYGQTYNLPADSSVKDVLQMSFDEFGRVVETNGLKSKFAGQGLNMYQGITLASIVQRELSGNSSNLPSEDQRLVAGVFYNRLRSGISLGSDVTYQYIADKLGVPRDTNLDNPYNTRRYPGLPPGPIASPGLTALLAVANPATTDYLFFLSGDDDKMYYAKTNAEHQQNIAKHCQKKCQIL